MGKERPAVKMAVGLFAVVFFYTVIWYNEKTKNTDSVNSSFKEMRKLWTRKSMQNTALLIN